MSKPVLRFAARRASGGRIAQQSLPGKRSAAGGSAGDADAVKRGPAGGNAGATPVPTAKPVPMPRPAPRRATLHAKYFTKRASPSSPIGPLCQWTSRDAATCAPAAAPPCLSAAIAIVAIATAPGRALIRPAGNPFVPPVIDIKPAGADVMPTLNANAATGRDSKK